MTKLVDTHCHIQSAGVDKGEASTKELWSKSPELTRDKIVENAINSGVSKLICVGCNLPDSILAVEFAQMNDACYSSIGIHPHEAKLYRGKNVKLNKFAALIERDKVVAVGECGLDYYYTHSPKEDQIEVLKYQIELALSHGLPLIFHVREAFGDFWPIFDEYKGIRGVLHSYTDSLDNLKEALSRKLYIGVNGISTFTRDSEQLDVYRSIPLKNLLLETDSPFLTPTPYRGSINEPKQVRTIAEYLSFLRQEPLEDLISASTDSANRLFGI